MENSYADYRCPGCEQPRPITTVRERRRLDSGGIVYHSRECQKLAGRETRPCKVCTIPVTRRRSEFTSEDVYCPTHRGAHKKNAKTYPCDNPSCSNEVERTPGNVHGSIYCSQTCFGEGIRKEATFTATCAGCKIPFPLKEASRISRAKKGEPVYHSRDCWKASTRVELPCSGGCGKTLWRYRSQLAKRTEDREVRVFCDECRKTHGMKPRTGNTKPCGSCGNPVYKRPSEDDGGPRYCGHACHGKAIEGPRVERPVRVCIVCEESFSLEPDQVRQDVKTCSRECTTASRRRKPGERYVDGKGYAWITTPDGRSMFEHRYKMEVLLADVLNGEPLPKGVNVHHISGVKSDNTTDGPLVLGPEGRWRSGNLELWVTSQPSGQRLVDLIEVAVFAELEEYRRRFGPLVEES